MRRLRNGMDEQGYTFLESIFHLLITIAFLQLFLLFFVWKAPIERQFSDHSATEWELFAIDLQRLLTNVSTLEIADANKLSLRIDRSTYHVSQSGNVIRWQKAGEGHVPILTNVRSVNFTVDGSMITAHVTMLDGLVRERGFAVGLYPE
ncbi:competence type IV pilus minor pilin ComGF [Bacillus sp. OxB-1]|uniref:competence type IV pilus minor pilin ComGF n=1 Tax=Bacillus sp. (strain OxB-1) TaxID=98228 RepID=UPI00130E903E|nr:competence type IV pilus minor pilin ComGF [Bacillus sp. OxB-1]